MSKARFAVAMSGGVDSSVAAALLKKQGYEVIGITMNLFPVPKGLCQEMGQRNCCGWDATADAIRVAQLLDVPHHILDLRKRFDSEVMIRFCDEYARGRTPNPCILCNVHIKFDALIQEASKLGFDGIATGHHARIAHDQKNNRYLLRKGKDPDKDQSYFLYNLTQEQLGRALFPVGEYSKTQIRKLASEAGLPVAERPESQEICFIPDNDYIRFLKEKVPVAFQPGEIVNTDGQVLGQHQGIPHYTIGQRRGLGIASAHPLYVLEIDQDHNRIVVGENDQLYKPALSASSVHLISGDIPEGPLWIKAKIRYKHKDAPARVVLLDGRRARVDFDRPQRAITPGQSVVFYEDDVVIGGGIIQESIDA
jgi:tRNA-specific 2-thiouridylase